MEDNSSYGVHSTPASEISEEFSNNLHDKLPDLRSCHSDDRSTVTTSENDAIINISSHQTQETISMHNETPNDDHEVEVPLGNASGSANDTPKEDISVIEQVIDEVQNLVINEIAASCIEEQLAETCEILPLTESELSAMTASVSSLGASSSSRENAFEYKIKQIRINDTTIPIITQNENGPCPLIAVVNVLLLRSKTNPFASKPVVNAKDLADYIGDYILLSLPKEYSCEGIQRDFEYNMDDAISKFPKLQTGLDVNVKFTGVKEFEYTSECIIFDLLNIPLYHGWLVDPQAKDVEQAIGKLSYNQLVEKIITNKSSTESDLVTEALVAESFLERTASQLTYYGLCELNNAMKSGELAVFFRNNHFSTIYKHKNELFQLVTDQGFLHESNVVWETLSNIDGDGQFVDANFITVPPKPLPSGVVPNLEDPVNPEEQIQQDFLVALSLQSEENRENEIATNWEEYKAKELGITSDITDEELAWKLHEDEQKHAQVDDAARRGAAAAPVAPLNEQPPKQRSPSETQSGHSTKKKNDCAIL
ncbi:hypothetical protein CHUAL_011629 [Chamberlinius hualienensis]